MSQPSTADRQLMRVLLATLLALLASGVAARDGETLESPLVEDVERGDRLELRNYSGLVTVRVWDEARVRIRAEGRDGDKLALRRRGGALSVVPEAWAKGARSFEVRPPEVGVVKVVGQPPWPVDFQVAIPSWLPVLIEGPMLGVVVVGSEAPIEVTVMTGDIEVSGGRERVKLTTLSGSIKLEDAEGRITLAGSNGRMTARRCRGDLRIETTTGRVVLEALAPDTVEVTTVGGSITYRGALDGSARWDLSTHGGDIDLDIEGEPSARFRLRALRGQIKSGLAGFDPTDPRRQELSAGDASAEVHATTFSGTIRVDAAATNGLSD